MSPAAVSGAPAGEAALVSTLPDLSDILSQELCGLIAQQPFFKGLNSQQLQLLAASALEMKFETGATIFTEGSPARIKSRVTLMSASLGVGSPLG